MNANMIRPGGRRAIQVVASFADEAVHVSYLDKPQAGRISPLTAVLVGAGWATFVVGLIVFAMGRAGIGTPMLAGLVIGLYGVMRWRDERRSPHFTLGSHEDASLALTDPTLPAPLFPLVRSNGHDYELLFTEGMSGDVVSGGAQMPLRELLESQRATADGEFAHTYAYAIPDDAQVTIDLGQHTLSITSVAPERPLLSSLWARLDWSAQASNGVSLGVHAFLLLFVLAVPPDAKHLSLDLFDKNNALIHYVVKPQVRTHDLTPEDLHKAGSRQQGGAAKAHKGPAGRMGSKKVKTGSGRTAISGKSPDPKLPRQLAESKAQKAGVLGNWDALTGGHVASIFGEDSAIGPDAEDALGRLQGDHIGEAPGIGGLAMSGPGRYGGGIDGTFIGMSTRLGTVGTHGNGEGPSPGYGRPTGLKPKREHKVRLTTGICKLRGALSREIIRRVVRRHLKEIRHCYSQELQTNRSLSGRIAVEFTISGNGRVMTANIEDSTVNNTNVEQCVVRAVRRWLFPAPEGGGIVHVSYPFVMRTPDA